jgi:hypothetical protein
MSFAWVLYNTTAAAVVSAASNNGYGEMSVFDSGGTKRISLSGNGTGHLSVGTFAMDGTDGFTANGFQVVTFRQSAVTAPTGGSTVDSQARTAISDIINRLQTHGLIS